MLYLIRHGETAGNAGGIVQFPDAPLNERGQEQARRLGRRLAGIGIELILSSDYQRARMTAEAVQAATGAELRTPWRVTRFNCIAHLEGVDVRPIAGGV